MPERRPVVDPARAEVRDAEDRPKLRELAGGGSHRRRLV